MVTLTSVVFLTTTTWSQVPLRLGGEFQLNTYTTASQLQPCVAVGDDGDFLVVWQSNGSSGTDTYSSSIHGQRYNALGNRLGSQFQINTFTTGWQDWPSVAVDDKGDFVVVWASNGSYGTDPHGSSIQGQLFDAGGAPLGTQFQVNTYTSDSQKSPSMSMAPDGSFVVVWHSYGSYATDTSDWSIQGQRFDASGNSLEQQFQVNSYTSYSQVFPAVAVGADGRFVVVWESIGTYGTDSSIDSIQGQRFDNKGRPLGGQFQVNSYTSDRQRKPSVAVDAGGSFVVVWNSNGSAGSDTSGYSIQGQSFDAAGNRIGDEFQVNAYTTDLQEWPSVALDDLGNFVIVWHSYGSYEDDTDSVSIQARLFSWEGVPSSQQFQVNTFTADAQALSSVAPGPSGTFVVVWHSYGSYGTDTSRFSIQGQRFLMSLYADGFEFGDTSEWSSTVD